MGLQCLQICLTVALYFMAGAQSSTGKVLVHFACRPEFAKSSEFSVAIFPILSSRVFFSNHSLLAAWRSCTHPLALHFAITSAGDSVLFHILTVACTTDVFLSPYPVAFLVLFQDERFFKFNPAFELECQWHSSSSEEGLCRICIGDVVRCSVSAGGACTSIGF